MSSLCGSSSDVATSLRLPTSVPRLSTSHNGRAQDRVDRTSWQGVPLGDVECTAAVPLGDAEWHDRYVPRALLYRYVLLRITTRKTIESRAAQDLPDRLRYYGT